MAKKIVVLIVIGLTVCFAYNYQPLSKDEAEETKFDQQPLPVFPTTPHPKSNSVRSILFAEDFTSTTFPPSGWTRIQTNTGNNGVYNCFWDRFTTPEYVVRTLPASAGLWWSYNEQNEWLITPEITLTGSATNQYYLRYWYYGFCGSSDSDHYYTKIITASGDTNLLYDLSAQERGWNRYEEPVYIDLSAYAEQTIKIAWQVEDGPANHGISYVWFIDDIEVGKPEINDMGVASLLEIKSLPLVVGETDTFKIRVYNFGSTCQESVQVIMSANNDPIDSVMIDSIDAFDFIDLEFKWTLTNAGNYLIKFFTQLVGDEDATNDTVYKSVIVCPEYHDVPYAKDFNEDWGTFGNNPPFCGWQIIDNGDEPIKRWNRNDWFKGVIAIPYREVAAVRYAPREHQDEWLISPRINCSEADSQYTLSFWHQYEGYKNADPDTGYVLLSIDGGNNWTEITRYVGGVSELVSYGYQTHNITSLVAGQPNVKIAYRYFAYNAGRWQIDDFEVMYTKHLDATPIAITPLEAIAAEDTLDIQVIIKNVGQQDLTPGWYVYFQMRDQKDSALVSTTINPESTAAFVFQKYIPARDTYTLTVQTNYPGDQYPINDVLTRKIYASGWVQKMDIPTQNGNGKGVKHGGAMTVYLDSIFAFRGMSNEFYVYVPTQDTWYQRKAIPYVMKPDGQLVMKNVKAGGSLTTFDTVIYAFKGGGTNEFWAYYPGYDTWIRKQDIPKYYLSSTKPTKVKAGGALVGYDNSIYAFKGGNTREFWMYAPVNDSWIPRCSLLTVDGKKIKGGGALTALDTLIYAFVGGNSNHFYAYAPSLDHWTRLREPSFDNPLRPAKAKVKDGGALTALNGRIYAFRGGNKNLFGYYQPEQDSWYRLEDIPGIKKVKHGGSLVAYNGLIYALKGGNTREFWEYTPASATIAKVGNLFQSDNTSVQTENNLTGKNLEFAINPNPANNYVTISFNLKYADKVIIKIYNASGRLITTVVNEHLDAGNYAMRFATNRLAKGIYFVKYENKNNSDIVKLIIQ
ncbi:MAG: choice-of-anchor J domain-containing protein [candidate division WOR-3 bacterium]